MIRNRLFFSTISISILILIGCKQRRDFCDCMDVSKLFTDGFTLSQQELENKEEGCEWIQEELSQMEILKRMSSCYKVKPTEKENSSSSIEATDGNVQPITTTEMLTDSSPTTSQPRNVEISQPSDWSFVTNAVGKTTNDIQFMNIPLVQNRLKNLLGDHYQELDEIYRNSIAYEIFQNSPQSNNYWISFTSENSPQSFNCRIVINPNLDIINVLIKYNDKVNTFYENNIKLKGILYNSEYKDWNSTGE